MKKYKGQYWRTTDHLSNLYIIASITKNKACLINIGNGNRRGDGAEVEDFFNISEEEWNKIVASDPDLFELVANNIEELGNG